MGKRFQSCDWMGRKFWDLSLYGERELRQHFCWHWPGLMLMDFPGSSSRVGQCPGQLLARPTPGDGQRATPQQCPAASLPGATGKTETRTAVHLWTNISLCPAIRAALSYRPSRVISRVFNCMPHCSPDIFSLILQQDEVF